MNRVTDGFTAAEVETQIRLQSPADDFSKWTPLSDSGIEVIQRKNGKWHLRLATGELVKVSRGTDGSFTDTETGDAWDRYGAHYPPPNILDLIKAPATSATSATAEDQDSDFLTPLPKADPAMFYGLIGDIAKAAANGREVNKVSAAAAAISWLSAQVGRDVFIPVGDVRHPLNQYTLHVGRSAIAAKGESVSLVRRIDQRIRENMTPIDEHDMGEIGILGQYHDGGLSSREGLALFVHNGYTVGKDTFPPILDKRLWIFEPEFQNVLAQGKRDGNTLSSALRDIWDGGSIKPATKGGKIWATEPHTSTHGCITPYELIDGLERREITNGFGNRHLMVWAERTCLVPFPAPTPDDVVKSLSDRAEAVIRFAKGEYPDQKYRSPITLSDEARTIWADAYPTLKRREAMGETVTSLLERRAPITLRLAGLFAVSDQTLTIEAHHLNAALAWSRYHRDSVVFIFGREIEERRRSIERDGHRRKILDYLEGKDWVIRSELVKKGFGGHVAATQINDALQAMLADSEIEQRQESRDGAATNTKTFYRLSPSFAKDDFSSSAAKHAKDAKDGINTGFAGCETRAKHVRNTEPDPVVREVIG